MSEPESRMALKQSLQTVRDFIRYGISLFESAGAFYGHGTDNPLDEASQLVLFGLKLPADLPGHFMDANLTPAEKERVLDLLERRAAERVPAAYITHEAWFANLKFYVDERVLVPRSPIAELIDQQFMPWLEFEQTERILDLCTGSGCIAIACAFAFPETHVDAVDISTDALAVAKINVEQYGLTQQVQLIESDLMNNLGGQRYDLIVSNPPYVDASEIDAMPEEFRHEPALGLASGPDGLDAVSRILAEAASHLTDDGVLVVEVGVSEAALVEKFPSLPFLWLDFEHGGSGVFLLTRKQLVEHGVGGAA